MTHGTLNQVILIGHCAAAPDLRSTPQGTQIASFAVYTNYIRRDEQGTAIEERERHQVAAWGRLGEVTCQLLRKGSRVRVEGRLETHQWQDKETLRPRYRTQVVATRILFLDPPPKQHQQATAEGAGIPDEALSALEAREEIIEPPASLYEAALA